MFGLRSPPTCVMSAKPRMAGLFYFTLKGKTKGWGSLWECPCFPAPDAYPGLSCRMMIHLALEASPSFEARNEEEKSALFPPLFTVMTNDFSSFTLRVFYIHNESRYDFMHTSIALFY